MEQNYLSLSEKKASPGILVAWKDLKFEITVSGGAIGEIFLSCVRHMIHYWSRSLIRDENRFHFNILFLSSRHREGPSGTRL